MAFRSSRSTSRAICPTCGSSTLLDYRALGNAGLWCLGRLQTDADRERVIEGIAREAGIGTSADELAATLKRLAPRWFLVRDVHAREEMTLVQPRWAMSLMRGPMTRAEIRRTRMPSAAGR